MKAIKKHWLMTALFSVAAFLPFSAGAAVVDDMILLQGGTVTIGSPDNERQRGDDEKLHQVTLNAFYVSPFEVSQSLYQSVMGVNPSYYRGGK